MSTLCFATDVGDGFREAGFSKECRVDSQTSEANQKAIEAAGLSFIFGMRIPDIPTRWASGGASARTRTSPTGHALTQPWPAGPSCGRCDQVIYYSYKADRARRTLRGIDEQVAKAAKAVAGLASVKRNRFIKLDGTVKASTASWRQRPGTWPG